MADDVLGAPRSGAFLSLQQIFDKSLFGVRAQGGPAAAASPLDECRYRLADLKCGVGHLIPDNAYNPDFDDRHKGGGAVGRVLTGPLRNSFLYALSAGGIDVGDEAVMDLLRVLQDAHDAAFRDEGYRRMDFLLAFEERMKKVAEARGLVYTAPGAQA